MRVCTDNYTVRAIHYCHSVSGRPTPHGSWAILVQKSGAKVGCWVYALLRNVTEKRSDTGSSCHDPPKRVSMVLQGCCTALYSY